MALASGGRAELRIDRGDAELALSELDRATRLAEVAGDVIGRAELAASGHSPRCVRAANDIALEQAEAARRTADEHGIALLRAECAALAALAGRALGRKELADERRTEAVELFRTLGAATLLQRFEDEWSE